MNLRIPASRYDHPIEDQIKLPLRSDRARPVGQIEEMDVPEKNTQVRVLARDSIYHRRDH